ncbi:MAG: hypothetical protein GX675_03860 [Erysipelotrichaceae bacterium]|nr:hypothetical protein [Erysipelotrichaceae bacterium]
MKSKTIKQRNIPPYPYIIKSIRVKPTGILMLMIIIGFILLFSNRDFAMIGVLIISISSFSLLVLPDSKIIDYTNEYAIIYNCIDRDECKLIYWDEILSWQYKWHTDKDEMIIEMVDLSLEVIETYKRSTMIPYFKKYAAGKEKANRRIK